METTKIIYFTTLFAIVLIAAFFDIKKGIIPNKLIISGFIALAFFYIFKLSPVSPRNMILGLLAGGVPILITILISNGAMGGGDMKLLALIGAFTGVLKVFYILFFSIFSCAIIAIILIILKKKSLKSEIILAPFIAFATIFVIVLFDFINLAVVQLFRF